jgi:hypothetical protein
MLKSQVPFLSVFRDVLKRTNAMLKSQEGDTLLTRRSVMQFADSELLAVILLFSMPQKVRL